MGVEAMVHFMRYAGYVFLSPDIVLFLQVSSLNTKFSSQYAAEPWTQWSLNGTVVGQYKNAGSFSYVRIYK